MLYYTVVMVGVYEDARAAGAAITWEGAPPDTASGVGTAEVEDGPRLEDPRVETQFMKVGDATEGYEQDGYVASDGSMERAEHDVLVGNVWLKVIVDAGTNSQELAVAINAELIDILAG